MVNTQIITRKQNLNDREISYSRLQAEKRSKGKMSDKELLNYIAKRWEHFRPRFEDKSGGFTWGVTSIAYSSANVLFFLELFVL